MFETSRPFAERRGEARSGSSTSGNSSRPTKVVSVIGLPSASSIGRVLVSVTQVCSGKPGVQVSTSTVSKTGWVT